MKRSLLNALFVLSPIVLAFGCDIVRKVYTPSFINAYFEPKEIDVGIGLFVPFEYEDNHGYNKIGLVPTRQNNYTLSDTDSLTLHVRISRGREGTFQGIYHYQGIEYSANEYIEEEYRNEYFRLRDSLGDTQWNFESTWPEGGFNGIKVIHSKITKMTITSDQTIGGISAGEPLNALFYLYYVDAVEYIASGYPPVMDAYNVGALVCENLNVPVFLTKASADSKSDYGKDYIVNVLLMQLKNPLTEPGRYTFTVKMSFANGRTVSESASVTITE